jgi:hypothetical protein
MPAAASGNVRGMATDKERRAKLLRLKDSVRAFFEQTAVHSPGDSSWMSAFRAVQRNDLLANEFVDELRALIEYIEQEFGASVPAAAPTFHDESTKIVSLHDLGVAPPRPAAPRAAAPPPTPAHARAARPAPTAKSPPPKSPPPPAPPPVAPLRARSPSPAKPPAVPASERFPQRFPQRFPSIVRAPAGDTERSAAPPRSRLSPLAPSRVGKKLLDSDDDTHVGRPPGFDVQEDESTAKVGLPPEPPRRKR